MDAASTASPSGIGRDSSGAEPAADLNFTSPPLELLEHDVVAWCASRPDPSTLNIAAAYEELARLSAKEQSVRRWFRHGRAPRMRDELLGAFEPRRQLLRSRALDLSRGAVRPLKITDLPLEILRFVFDELRDYGLPKRLPQMGYRGLAGSDCTLDAARKRRRAIGPLRLVSRLFCELATPFMFPVLLVQLSQASLDFVDKISKHPGMAAGVRGIRIYLGYRPREYVDDIARFYDWRRDQIQNRENLFRHIMRGALTPLTEYQELLIERGYAEFCRLHDEQNRLLEERTFVDALAAAMARMPNARSIAFVSVWDPGARRNLQKALVANDHEALSQFVTSPMDSVKMPSPHGDVDVRMVGHRECTRLFWELPIALHRAGVALTELQLLSCPRYDSFVPPVTRAPAWDELAVACQNLETFTATLAGTPHTHAFIHLLPGAKNPRIDDYLGAVLSRCGPRLRCLKLSFRPLYRSDVFLQRLQAPGLPQLRELKLSGLVMQQATLIALCGSFGRELTNLELLDIVVDGRAWADAIDIIRGKGVVKQRVFLSRLEGGYIAGAAWTLSDSLAAAVARYLRRKTVRENPLRVLGW